MEFIIATLVAAFIFALGFSASQVLSLRFQVNAENEKLTAYRDAYSEAQRKIAEASFKEQEARKKYKEFPQTGDEEIQTYEQSLKNLGLTPEQVEKKLAERRKM